MRASLTGTVAIAVSLAWGLVGCSQQAREARNDPGSGVKLSVGESVDLTQVANQKAFGFRQAGAALRADGFTHRLALGRDEAELQSVAGPIERQRLQAKVSALLAAKNPASYRSARASLGRLLRRASTELSLRVLSVARSGYECVQTNGRLRVTADGVAERRFDGCSEHWKNGETTAEQSFRFEQRPDGSGDLVLQLRARIGGTTPSSVSVAADGLHLEGVTGERYLYGHGHWVDASGRRVEVSAKFTGDVIQLRVPASTIDTSSYPAVLDPVVGPEIGTDPPVPVPTTLGMYPALASDGNGFLAVQSVNGSIRAVRLDSNGNVLDLPWLDFGEATGGQYYPNVAYGGGHYLVSWDQFGDDDVDTIRARFVKPDGTLEGTSNFQLAGVNAMYPKLVWDGAHFIGAWLGLSGGGANNIQSALFSADGSVVAGTDRSVSTSGKTTDPCLVLGTNQALIAWEDYSATSGNYVVNGARIDPTGAIKDSTPLVLSPATSSNLGVAIGSNGSNFLVTWNTASDNYAVRGSVVNDAGTIIAGDVAISRSTGTAALPSVDFDGTNFLVAWADSRDGNSIYGVNVSPAGVVASSTDTKLATGSPRSISSGSMDRIGLAYNGSRHLLSFLGSGIEASLLEKNLGIVKGQIALTAIANLQGYPRMVYDGKNYVVAWTDERNGSSSSTMIVRGVRISGTGAILDPDGISISPANTTAYNVSVASAGNQTTQLFYTNGETAPNQRTLSSDGALSDPKAYGTAVSTPNVASNGTTLLATTVTGDSSNGRVYGRILDASGNAGAEFLIDASTVNTGTSIVPTKGGYLVTYSNSGTRMVTVSDTGQLGTSSLFASGNLYVGGASSGTESLVVWSNSTDYKVYGRFLQDGAFTGAEFLIAESSLGYTPAITWDGTNYLVVWEVTNHYLEGRTVSSSGSLGTLYRLVTDDCSAPVLASNGQGQVLLSYAKYGELWQSRRVYSRIITQGGASNVPEATAGAGGMGTGQGGSVTAGGSSWQGGTATTTGAVGPTSSGGTSASLGGSTSASLGGSTSATLGGTSATLGGSTGGTPPPSPVAGSSGVGVASSGGTITSSSGGSTGTTTSSSGGSTGTTTSSSGGANGSGTTTPAATAGTTTTDNSGSLLSEEGGCSLGGRRSSPKPWLALVLGAFAATALRRRRHG